MSTLAFKLLSRSAGSVHMLLCRMYDSFPFKLFRLLERDPDTTAAILAAARCLYDDFTRDFRDLFPTDEDLVSEECLLLLQCLAHLASNDTVKIEARHATLRRALLRSIQTWRRSIHCLITDFFLLQQRLAERGPWRRMVRERRRPQSTRKGKRPHSRKRPLSQAPRAVLRRARSSATGKPTKASSSSWQP